MGIMTSRRVWSKLSVTGLNSAGISLGNSGYVAGGLGLSSASAGTANAIANIDTRDSMTRARGLMIGPPVRKRPRRHDMAHGLPNTSRCTGGSTHADLARWNEREARTWTARQRTRRQKRARLWHNSPGYCLPSAAIVSRRGCWGFCSWELVRVRESLLRTNGEALAEQRLKRRGFVFALVFVAGQFPAADDVVLLRDAGAATEPGDLQVADLVLQAQPHGRGVKAGVL